MSPSRSVDNHSLTLTTSSSTATPSPTKANTETNESSSKKDKIKKKSCCGCCCLWLLLVLGIGLIAGGLAWYLLPEDTKEELSTFGQGTQAPTSSPAPTTAPTAPWRFHQCADDTTDGTNGNCCQGLDVGTCDMRANQILYAYMHNAVHTIEDGFLFPWNHEFGLEKALEAGYRALELDVGRCGDDETVVFYHSRCALGTRNTVQVLKSIGSFMARNPTEIVVLFLQMPEQDVVSLTQFDDVLQTVPSVANLLYEHTLAGTAWPTLQEMIDTNQRIILFYKNQPSCRQQTCPNAAWHYWNDYGVETLWDFRSVGDVDDTNNSCSPNYGVTTPRDFYRVNAFTSLPSKSAAKTFNTYQYAKDRMEACAERQGQDTNFYAVDYWDQGQVLQLTQDINRQRAADQQA